MATTQINGGTQIRPASIPGSVLTSNAGITDAQLATPYLKADGTRALTGAISAGGFQINSLGAPSLSTDAANKSYVDTAIAGLSGKLAAVSATNTETLTIAGGSVTQIAGTTVNGVSPNVGDYVLIPNAPAATGAAGGATLTSQPANGLYQVTNNTTNLTVSRASDMSGSINPMGASIVVVGGSVWGGADLLVTTPSSSAAFTYGTGSIAFTQMSGAGEITVDSTLTKTGNQIVRAAITGDVAVPSNSNTATIQAAAVSLSKMANLAANSVIGNTTGSAATPTAVPLASAATANAIALRDGNGNLTINSLVEASQSFSTAAGTTTLTVSSPQLTQFTGTTTQTCVLPNATTLANGQQFTITNRSTGLVTVQTNGGATLQTMSASSQLTATVISNGTSAGVWDAAYSFTTAGGTGTVTSVSVATANGFAGTVATNTTTPAITLTTSVTGLLKGNGTAISAATAGTDYLAPSSIVTRETPTGTVNGSNTTFTLANTPISGTEMVFLNGLLMEPGWARLFHNDQFDHISWAPRSRVTASGCVTTRSNAQNWG
jgi:hypothetical protein